MAKYKILKEFKDVHTKDIYKKGDLIEFSEERVSEIETNLEKHGGRFIEKEEKKMTVEAIKDELDKLGVDYKDAKVKADFEKLLEDAESKDAQG